MTVCVLFLGGVKIMNDRINQLIPFGIGTLDGMEGPSGLAARLAKNAWRDLAGKGA